MAYQQQQQQQQHFIKYKHTMKFTGLIASALMLLLAVMASTASARSIEFPDQPQKFCCNAISARCEACKAGVSVEEICRTWVVDSSDPFSFRSRPLPGCPKKQPKQCCRAFTLECQACDAGVSEEEFCRRYPHSPVCPQKKQCCRAFTLECQACDAGLSEEEFCRRNPHSPVCPQRSNAAELSLWSAKLVTPVSPRRNSAEGTLTHLSALRSLPN